MEKIELFFERLNDILYSNTPLRIFTIIVLLFIIYKLESIGEKETDKRKTKRKLLQRR